MAKGTETRRFCFQVERRKHVREGGSVLELIDDQAETGADHIALRRPGEPSRQGDVRACRRPEHERRRPKGDDSAKDDFRQGQTCGCCLPPPVRFPD
jgi:hypothetical protein